MTGKHTPGPWTLIIPKVKTKRPSVEIDAKNRFVCDVWGWGDEVQANARLIAAAPELLEALKLALLSTDANADLLEWRMYAQASIAKSEGRE